MTPKEMRSRRLALGLSVGELARQLRMPESELREVEAGERALSAPELVEAIFARLERARRTELP